MSCDVGEVTESLENELCDFHIFGDLKKDIRGRRLHSDDEVQE